MNWNTNTSLPFNPTAPERQPMNITLNNPPCVPPYNGPGPLQNIAPLAAAALAIEIQNRAPSNPLRTFMYNQYSNNGYQNQDFAALVEATLDFVGLSCTQGRFNNVEQALQTCVPQMCEMLCAVNLTLFPALEQFVTNETAPALRNLIGQFQNLAGQIKNWRMSGGQAGGGSNWGGQPQSSWGSGNSWAGGGGWGNTGGGAGFDRRWGGGNAVQPSAGSTGLFQNASSGRQMPAQASTGFVSSKYGNDSDPIKQPFQARQAQTQQPAQQETTMNTIATAEVQEASAASGKIKWKPSVKYPYFPASTPSLGELWLRKHPDGSVEPFFKERDQSMDYDRHAIGGVFGMAPRQLDLSHAADTMQRIEDGIKQVNKAAVAPQEEKSKPEIITYVKPEATIVTDEVSALLNGALARLAVPGGRIPDVYRVHAIIADPIVTMHDETDAVKNFGASKSYIELREKLNSALNEISPELWGAVNTKMTTLVNRILKMNLGLVNVSIDSFVTDIEDLLNYLGKKGNLYRESFEKHAREVIYAAFQTLLNDHSSGFTEGFIDGLEFADGGKPQLTYVASNYSLTYLNALSYELDIELSKDTASVVTKALSPIMNEMLEGLFTSTEGSCFERYLIITNDGRQLEATKGYLNESAYLLTLVK
jgi:hypothetical protein